MTHATPPRSRRSALACDGAGYVLVVLALLFAGSPAAAIVYTYDNTTTGTIPELASNALCNGGTSLVRTFTVPESFTVSTIALGINLTHTDRGQIRAILNAPDGSSAVFLTQTAASGDDPDNNYDILISTNTEGTRDDGDDDPTTAPFFSRLVSLAGANFFAGNANGTWTLRICDRFTAGGLGTFNRARLVLTSTETVTSQCTSTVSYDWGTNGDLAAFTNATVGDITVTQGTTTDYVGSGTPPEFQTRTTTTGAHAGWYGMAMDSAAGVDIETLGLATTLTFSQPITALSFMAMDVDFTTGAWEDQLHVFGFDSGGNRVAYSAALSTAHQAAGDWVEGDVSVPSTSADANITYVFAGAVSSVQIEYTQGDDPADDTSFMFVGVSDFGFCAYDYGDAPNTYGTQLAGGARHVLGARTLYLGTNQPDGESDGQPASAATTDDTTQVGGVDDEDGVASFPAHTAGSSTYTVSVTANNRSTTTAASLVGYLDWNRDGDFADANEISATVSVPVNTINGAFNVTWSAVPTNGGGTTATYARFRISFTASEVTSPTGLATSGEVEDYPVSAGTLPVTLSSFESTPAAGGLNVAWTTETETANVGFYLWGQTPRGLVLLSNGLVPSRGTDSLSPQRYRVRLKEREVSALLLDEVSLTGERKSHGPFALGRAYGKEPAAYEIDWQAVREEAETALAAKGAAAVDSASGFPVALLAVSQDGLQRVTYEELAAAGLDLVGAPVDRLGLREARGGSAAPIYVQTATPGVFGPGSFVEFLGTPRAENLYGRERMMRLAVEAAPTLKVRSESGVPAGSPLARYTATVRTNNDRLYNFASPNGDPWYEAAVLAQAAPAEKIFPLEVSALEPGAARLEVRLWGVNNWPGAALDHHLELWLNGTRLAEERFDGLVARTINLVVPAGLLVEGTNQLKVRLPGDTGFAFDLVHVDRYEISYPRRFAAGSDRLSFAGAPGRIDATGFASPDLVVYTKNGKARLTGVAVTAEAGLFRASFKAPRTNAANARVEISTVAALHRPRIEPARAVPGDLFTGPGEYLVIAHPAFLAGIEPLASARATQGLDVKVVDVRDLYAAYSGGEVDPEAIRSYLRSAAPSLGTRFVLLVGGDTYDPLDHLGLGSVSFIPTLYVQTDELIRYTPADSLFADLDSDGVQDLAVGRLPARTTAELSLLLGKTLSFSTAGRRAVFAADGSSDRAFAQLSDFQAGVLPGGWSVGRAYVDELGVPGARAALISAVNGGATWVNYVGHSGPTAWSFQGLFSAGDVAGLTNISTPALVVQWGCWNTYHVSPRYDTMAHRLLLAGAQGAAVVIGSSTLSKTSSDEILGPRLTAELAHPGATIGEALVAAKRAIAARDQDLRDVLLGWTLLGDPALVVEP